MPRPLIQLGVGNLEALFAKSRADMKVLKQLEHELQHRQVPRAVALLAEVQDAMSRVQSVSPAATPPNPDRAPVPKQQSLLDRPATPAAAARPIEPVVNALVPTPIRKTPQSAQPSMSLDDAYKLLKMTAGSTWESIEHNRRQLVQQSHPARLKVMSPEKQMQTLAEAKRVNAAYGTLSQARCGGR